MARLPLARLRRPLFVLAAAAAVVALLAWLMGAFHDRMPPGHGNLLRGRAVAGDLLELRTQRVRRHETAVGTVRAIHETVVASRVLGRVESLAITRAGQPVTQGDVLATLESKDLQAVLDQAKAALQVAATRRDQAKVDLDRTTSLVASGAAAGDRLERDRSAFSAAEAEVERARQTVAAAESSLGYTTIEAPMSGIVVDKLVQVGDVVQPGQPICTLYDPTRLQLVAVVREELAGRLTIGQEVDVRLDAIALDCRGRVAEIVPAAQAQSRSFEVKVTGPCHEGVVTGMFGRLAVPLDEIEVLRIPRIAVHAQGQLDFVYVVEQDRALRRLVRLGAVAGSDVEVLSGLAAGEWIELPKQGR